MSYGETDTGTTDDTAATTTNSAAAASVMRGAPHGRALTACLIAGNVALVALIYLYFWRLFSRKRSASSTAGDDEDDDASSAASTPPPPSPLRDQDRREQHDHLDVASLPTFVVRSAGEKQQEECAVCIAELRNGDEARALPRCGHRFHAPCVDAWLRRHTTCPLCRASVVVVPAAPGAGPKGAGGVADTTAASDVEDMDEPV